MLTGTLTEAIGGTIPFAMEHLYTVSILLRADGWSTLNGTLT